METLFIVLFVFGLIFGVAKIVEVLRKPTEKPAELFTFQEKIIDVFGEKISIIPASYVHIVEDAGNGLVAITFISQSTGKQHIKMINPKVKYDKSPSEFIHEFRKICIKEMVNKK